MRGSDVGPGKKPDRSSWKRAQYFQQRWGGRPIEWKWGALDTRRCPLRPISTPNEAGAVAEVVCSPARGAGQVAAGQRLGRPLGQASSCSWNPTGLE